MRKQEDSKKNRDGKKSRQMIMVAQTQTILVDMEKSNPKRSQS